MKHEYFNSIVALLGLTVATVTAIFQFWPNADALQIVTESRVDVGKKVEITKFGAPNLNTGGTDPVFGPVTWKIRVYNPLDQGVSLVGYKFFQLDENNQKIYSSAFADRLSPVGVSLNVLDLPDNIGARETKAYFFSFMVPFKNNADCNSKNANIHEFEKCFWAEGVDFLGNSVESTFDQSAPPKLIFTRWLGREHNPRFSLELETADGSFFKTEITYYPF